MIEQAWPDELFLFRCPLTRDPTIPYLSTIRTFPAFAKVGRRLSKGYRRLDLLIVRPPTNRSVRTKSHIANWIDTILNPEGNWRLQPKLILLIHEANELNAWDKNMGDLFRSQQKRLRHYGYQTIQWFLPSRCYNSAIKRELILNIATRKKDIPHVPLFPPREANSTCRPMINLLTPTGLTKHKKFPTRCYDELTNPGTSLLGFVPPYKEPVLHPLNPMIPKSFWIPIENSDPRQARLISPSEYAKALGFPTDPKKSSWLTKHFPYLRGMLDGNFFHFILPQLLLVIQPDSMSNTEDINESLPRPITNNVRYCSQQHPFEVEHPWQRRLPDLSPNGTWWRKRVRKLKELVRQNFPHQPQLIHAGEELLRKYTKSLTTENITLNLLWWEWPTIIREEIRLGFPMNLASTPPLHLSDNPTYTQQEQKVAAEFVEELIQLGVVEEVLENESLLMNGPLSVIPKPNQPGQFRVISDMRRGGQNKYIGTDPVNNPSMMDILNSLTPGGYMAIVDVAKEFYHFQLREQDRNYAGILHPQSGKHFRYRGCPMGSSSSPGIANRGISTIMLEYREAKQEQCTLLLNDPLGPLYNQKYHPHLAEGMIHMNKELPLPIIWIQVDDFLIHAATLEQCINELNDLLEFFLDKGILAHGKKVIPPAQIQRFCGFEFDTRSIPKIAVTAEKQSTAISCIDYLINCQTESTPISKLTLAVVIGKLQSLTPATQANIGSIYLRSLYHSLHDLKTLDSGDPLYYYREAHITSCAWKDLKWWKTYLQQGPSHQSRATHPPRDCSLLCTTINIVCIHSNCDQRVYLSNMFMFR